MTVRIVTGDCRDVLADLPAATFQTCVTSPPYFNLRDYGHERQIGREQTREAYIAEMVDVFRGVRRCLRPDGTMWLNLGDSYGPDKQLLGIPWGVAFGLQSDGWTLRSAIVWAKPNPMPDPTKDRPTNAYEMLFLFAPSPSYYYDAAAIAEPATEAMNGRVVRVGGDKHRERNQHSEGGGYAGAATRNARNIWSIVPEPFGEGHFATMPPEMAERCIKAGSRPGDAVLDPFGGAGTTGLVADRLGRHATLIELNPEYVRLAEDRIRGDAPLFAEVGA